MEIGKRESEEEIGEVVGGRRSIGREEWYDKMQEGEGKRGESYSGTERSNGGGMRTPLEPWKKSDRRSREIKREELIEKARGEGGSHICIFFFFLSFFFFFFFFFPLYILII